MVRMSMDAEGQDLNRQRQLRQQLDCTVHLVMRFPMESPRVSKMLLCIGVFSCTCDVRRASQDSLFLHEECLD